MKITREGLKNLILEEVTRSQSILIEMPSMSVPYRTEDRGKNQTEEPVDLTRQKLFHIARQADQLHELLKADELLTDDARQEIEDVSTKLKKVFEAVMYDKQNPKGR